MARHLDRARAHLGRHPARFLEGGRYALIHTRSLEFDELRPYVPGDDVRDIDWKATARSGHPLIKRFVSEKHHKILVVADAGRNVAALAPSGETKLDIALDLIGAMGLIAVGRSDEIGLVFGDHRGCVDTRLRRGATHVEHLLHRFHHQATTDPAASDIVTQLDWVGRHYRHSMLILVVADEPTPGDRLSRALRPLVAGHDVAWAMVADMPAICDDDVAGRDVRDGRVLPSGATLGPKVLSAYRRAEEQRRVALRDFLTEHGVPHATVPGSAGIGTALTSLTGVLARAR